MLPIVTLSVVMFYCFHCELISNKIVDFNRSLVYFVVQFNFHVRDSVAISSVETGIQLWKIKANVRPHFLTLGYC